MDVGVSREPFNHKRASRTMDEPSNIWDKLQADETRWTPRARRREHIDGAYLFVWLAVAAVFLGAAWLICR